VTRSTSSTVESPASTFRRPSWRKSRIPASTAAARISVDLRLGDPFQLVLDRVFQREHV
jgi:hypothetical protein